jgi:hypothetical protein
MNLHKVTSKDFDYDIPVPPKHIPETGYGAKKALMLLSHADPGASFHFPTPLGRTTQYLQRYLHATIRNLKKYEKIPADREFITRKETLPDGSEGVRVWVS